MHNINTIHNNFPRPSADKLFARAQNSIPGGVNSPVRSFAAVGGTPVFIDHANGCWLYDTDGYEYVDLVCSWGPMILGHAHPQVVAAVQNAATGGLSFGAPTEIEVCLAEKIHSLVPPAQKVRLVNSGTEATMSAIRLARAVTGRNKIIKFSGCYHGHSDSLLSHAGSGVATLGLPSSPGVTQATTNDTIVLPYNDVAAVAEAFATYEQQIAAVITEAAPGNMGVVPPVDGFNAQLAHLCHKNGALLILDEVMTGFRVSKSGWYGLDLVDADLFTFGKVMSGGLPAAAFAGKAEIMDLLAPIGPVYQAGTLSGNPVAVAAGLATLELATEEVYQQLNAHAFAIGRLAQEALTKAGVEHRVQYAGNMFSIFFTSENEPVLNYDQVHKTQFFRYAPFFHALLDHGVYAPPSAFESWFVSSALCDRAYENLESALKFAAQAAGSAKGK